VVSKYIGETEKNLEQVFSAAAAGEVLLFFDEADALFGKRSEVSDAHDRYANIEVAYLLQRLEAHDGLVVMATNLQQNLDPAFLRRIDVLVGFPEPDQAQRLAIWRRSFGEAAPVEGVDLDWVAQRFELTGGEIRNVALEAAFRAAGTGGPITMGAVMAALHREQRKGGRLCNRDDFDHWPGRPPDPLSDLAAAPGDRQAPRAPMPPMPPTRRPREARGAAAAR
jgi:SpoVK/Ycf46/Vps4 family AAA+-type ATPase